ncbi:MULTISPECIES: hypothetical protein [Haloarcula]|uniref:hypothetical protein n=1 Tax=Haloarcula TaxID=2237 RepID=UPI0023EB511B|nr:hypothetical protein [Halomicroarcula sp. XH51]
MASEPELLFMVAVVLVVMVLRSSGRSIYSGTSCDTRSSPSLVAPFFGGFRGRQELSIAISVVSEEVLGRSLSPA